MYLLNKDKLVTEIPTAEWILTQSNSLADTTTGFDTDDNSYHAKFLLIYGFIAMLIILAVYSAIRGDIYYYIYQNVLLRILHTLYDLVGLEDIYSSDGESILERIRWTPPGVGLMTPVRGSPVPETRQNPTAEETAPKKAKEKNKKEKHNLVWHTGVHQARSVENESSSTPSQQVSTNIPEDLQKAEPGEIILRVV